MARIRTARTVPTIAPPTTALEGPEDEGMGARTVAGDEEVAVAAGKELLVEVDVAV